MNEIISDLVNNLTFYYLFRNCNCVDAATTTVDTSRDSGTTILAMESTGGHVAPPFFGMSTA